MTRAEIESKLVMCEKFHCRLLLTACELMQRKAVKEWTRARKLGGPLALPVQSTTMQMLSACGHCERRIPGWPEGIDETVKFLHSEFLAIITEKEDSTNAIERRECGDTSTMENGDRESDSLVPGENAT